ncbi:Amidohydrolase EgtC [Nonomuraea coxensis DSM 45129]|uniref:Gamma-glutamyl-hercynylcysteine sulfoxide hydrolase n=1 Tax=Nonomuraea coxensis DSM 45129 TaxID=1122611 RepID=A0ABX8TZT8_9ACTN|nr:class II glutamine amidotransferase [Nonomuraea coxensis]QYC40004.1 Amidohydrolase EgtC [Nonomuraea coxensis DSM 45129]
MCRHAAWLGAPRTLAELIHEPEHGLLRQSYAPRRQRHGTVNADGFGMGWYDPDLGPDPCLAAPEPIRYRRSIPMWADANLPGLARVARSGCLLAAVRCATVGMPVEESATAPFTEGRWLLSHNGRVDRDALRDLAEGAESACDSAWLAAAVFRRLRADCSPAPASAPSASSLSASGTSASGTSASGTSASGASASGTSAVPAGAALGEALAEVVTSAAAKDPDARLNLLACDGVTLAATAWGDTLFHRPHPDGVLVASEPLCDGPGWQEVPDRSLLLATADGLRVQPL